MPPGLQRLLVGHMGCYAAIPGLAAVSDFVAARARPAVLLCCELTSLHVQPAQADLEQVVAHALFSDAAAAVVLEPGAARGRRVAGDRRAHRLLHGRPHDLGRHRPRLPHGPVAARPRRAGQARRAASSTSCSRRPGCGSRTSPAGRCIPADRASSTSSATSSGLTEEQIGASRRVLAEHGNCSSATVLLVLDELADVDGPVVAMAFGPGLTLYAALLLPA